MGFKLWNVRYLIHFDGMVACLRNDMMLLFGIAFAFRHHVLYIAEENGLSLVSCCFLDTPNLL